MLNMQRFIVLIALLTPCSLCADPIPSHEIFLPPSMSNVSFSPDGKYISALTREKGKAHLSLINMQTQKRTSILEFGKYDRFEGYDWLDNDTLFLRVYTTNKHRRALLYLAEKNGTVTAEYRTVRSKGYLVSSLPSEPNKVLFARNMFDDAPSNRLYKVTYEELRKGILTKKNEFERKVKNVIHFGYDNNRKELYAVKKLNSDNAIVISRKIKNRWQQLYRIDNNKDTFIPLGLLSETKLAVLTNQKSNTVGLYEFDIPSQKLTSLIYKHQKYDLINASINKNQKISHVTYVENGQQKHHYFADEIKSYLTELPDLISQKMINIVDISSTGQRVLFTHGSDEPGKFYLYDPEDRSIKFLDSYLPSLNKYELAKTESFKVATNDNQEIEAFLTHPSKIDNQTLIVMPHGGPIGVREYDVFHREIQYLASRGFSILRVNYRGSSGYGRSFLDSGKGQFGQAIEEDISLAVDYVLSKNNYKKLCTYGSSYGGYSAVMLTIKDPKRYHCAIGTFGIYDLPLLFSSSNLKAQPESQKAVSEVVGPYSPDLTNVSPVYLAARIPVPVLLIAGEKDYVAEIEHTRRLAHTMKLFNKQVETLYYRNTGHGHLSWDWERHQASYIADYLEKTLELKPISVSKKQKIELAKDMALLADGYRFNNNAPTNEEKAIEYYRKAAELGHLRSMFNFALLLLDEQQNEGIKWLLEASNNEYSRASYELAHIYKSGEIVDQDHQLALKYFTLADRQGFDARAQLEIAKSHCLGLSVEIDKEKCVTLFDIQQLRKSSNQDLKAKYNSKVNKYRRQLIDEMYFSEPLTQKGLLLMHKILSQDKVHPLTVNIEDETFGIVVRRVFENKLQRISEPFTLQSDTIFSVRFISDWQKEHLPKGKQVIIFAHWTQKDQSGKIIQEEFSSLQGNSSFRWQSGFKVNKELAKNGTVSVKMKDIFNNIIYEKTIKIVKGE
ncbi:hypothetical protein SOPP22_04865 [Shewanella sp. OPT22]|nr:hypothetical protein SOPP22_04865 [Shewanella sp. OPT22]